MPRLILFLHPREEKRARNKIKSAVNTHKKKHPNWTDPEYDPGEVANIVPPPDTLEKARAKCHEVIEQAKNNPSMVMKPEMIATFEYVKEEDPELWVAVKVILRNQNTYL